ncbi:hypothetical protein ACFPRL_15670 [Pseudoclavibacter helvolus]
MRLRCVTTESGCAAVHSASTRSPSARLAEVAGRRLASIRRRDMRGLLTSSQSRYENQSDSAQVSTSTLAAWQRERRSTSSQSAMVPSRWRLRCSASAGTA